MIYETLSSLCSCLCLKKGNCICQHPGGCLLDLQYDLYIEGKSDEDKAVLVALKKEYKVKDKYGYPCLVFTIKELRKIHEKGSIPKSSRRAIELIKEVRKGGKNE